MVNYEKIRQEYLESVKNERRAMHSWKMAFFYSAILLFVAIIYNFRLSEKSQIIPYVIEVESSTGNALRIDLASKVNYSPTEANISYHLKEFIRNMKMISKDVAVLRMAHSKNLYFLEKDTIGKYKGILKEDNINEKFLNGETRDLEIVSFMKMPGENLSYQMRWNENTYNKSGEKINTRGYIGSFVIEIIQPTTIEELDKNPLGIKIKDFSISKESY